MIQTLAVRAPCAFTPKRSWGTLSMLEGRAIGMSAVPRSQSRAKAQAFLSCARDGDTSVDAFLSSAASHSHTAVGGSLPAVLARINWSRRLRSGLPRGMRKCRFWGPGSGHGCGCVCASTVRLGWCGVARLRVCAISVCSGCPGRGWDDDAETTSGSAEHVRLVERAVGSTAWVAHADSFATRSCAASLSVREA